MSVWELRIVGLVGDAWLAVTFGLAFLTAWMHRPARLMKKYPWAVRFGVGRQLENVAPEDRRHFQRFWWSLRAFLGVAIGGSALQSLYFWLRF